MIAFYEQPTGVFVIGAARCVGYAGRGVGRNNPGAEATSNLGPLPRGSYSLSRPQTHRRLGPLAYRLTPAPQNRMYGRSGFWIHGDNSRGDASHGCIILPRWMRSYLSIHPPSELRVVSVLNEDSLMQEAVRSTGT